MSDDKYMSTHESFSDSKNMLIKLRQRGYGRKEIKELVGLSSTRQGNILAGFAKNFRAEEFGRLIELEKKTRPALEADRVAVHEPQQDQAHYQFNNPEQTVSGHSPNHT